ncbi:sensor domain-containing diguanylate cyclase [Paenibacillus cremeus]|uniref:sensor domain-containing diguanylate cyclase n=1 Tax=Paenibacillus cremeus TaxID=2163881 RepID=UPI0028F703F2|nr:sensor domain-containing diguanylate cyclase [Paenibacillus cremeus]
MSMLVTELDLFKNFDELSNDILEMAKDILPDKLIYLTTFTASEQWILKLSERDTDIRLSEGMKIPLQGTVCNRIDFKRNQPLIYEDMSQETTLDDLRTVLLEANINSYVGIPIILTNGEAFGTLCAAQSIASEFNFKSISLLQKIAKLFSYYLDLERIAFRDSLTGLYNRQFLYMTFKQISMIGGTLFYLDLDGFKQVNDTLGHDAGDLVLKEVASRLERFVREHNGFAVRLGGDEFIVTLMEVTSREEVSRLADRLVSYVSTWDNELKEFRLSASIGVVTYCADKGHELERLLKDSLIPGENEREEWVSDFLLIWRHCW